mgnify:CR=1 FL=1
MRFNIKLSNINKIILTFVWLSDILRLPERKEVFIYGEKRVVGKGTAGEEVFAGEGDKVSVGFHVL